MASGSAAERSPIGKPIAFRHLVVDIVAKHAAINTAYSAGSTRAAPPVGRFMRGVADVFLMSVLTCCVS
jgi:hypothetical protein